MSKQIHTVKRQIIDLEIENSDQAPQIQAEMSRIYRQQIVPLIDQYCTSLSSPNQLHRIDTLEINLGKINLDNLETEMIAKIRPALQEALAQKIQEQEHVAQTEGKDTKSQSKFELFVFFMETGFVPWWADTSEPNLINTTIDYLIQASSKPLQQYIAKQITNPQFLKRLITHVADKQIIAIVSFLAPAAQQVVKEVMQELITAVSQAQPTTQLNQFIFRQKMWRLILHTTIFVQQTSSSREHFLETAVSILTQELETNLQLQPSHWQQYLPQKSQLQDILRQNNPEILTPNQIVAQKLKMIAHHDDTIYQKLVPLLAQLTISQQRTILTLMPARQETLTDEIMDAVLKAAQETVTNASHPSVTNLLETEHPLENLELDFSHENEIYIDNAGLILLWPFLTHFFDRLGLTIKNQFTDDQAQQQAVALLQYIAIDDTNFPEYQLPLNKLLCGMGIEEVYALETSLKMAELEECTQLLTAVIAQAPILNNMSIPAFRATFLLRQGVLKSRDGAWLLQVERETYDVVLDRFPWSWEWIKLPWMEAPCRVEW